MFLKRVSLTNFKQYARLEAELPPKLIVVQGDNAQGKTSLLEAIYMAATAKTPTASGDRQVIRWDAEEEGPYPSAVVRAHVQRREGTRLIEVAVQKGEGGRTRKDIRIDRVARRRIDLVGQLTVVLFLPSDVDIVGGGPALRREFLDQALTQVDATYVTAIDRYEKTLTQRNALLRQSAERRVDADELAVWDEQLAPDAVYISLARRRALAKMSQLAFPLHRELSNASEFLQIRYEPSFDAARPKTHNQSYQIGFDTSEPPAGMDESALRAAFLQALQMRRSEELARGVTLTGPHRDEFRFMHGGVDLGEFGSRGQQRTAVLAIKMAQVEWMRELLGEEPILLLDEVLAELDPHRRRCLLRHIASAQQTLITTTDISRIEREVIADAAVFTVRQGVITPEQ
jgi:DNA replication and repair protein RecF